MGRSRCGWAMRDLPSMISMRSFRNTTAAAPWKQAWRAGGCGSPASVAQGSRARSAALKSSWPTGPRRGGNNEAFSVHHGRQGPGLSLHAWSHPLMAQGDAGELSPGGSRLPQGLTRPGAGAQRRIDALGGVDYLLPAATVSLDSMNTASADRRARTSLRTPCSSASRGLECRKSSRFEASLAVGTVQPCISIAGSVGGSFLALQLIWTTASCAPGFVSSWPRAGCRQAGRWPTRVSWPGRPSHEGRHRTINVGTVLDMR